MKGSKLFNLAIVLKDRFIIKKDKRRKAANDIKEEKNVW